jgi:hypothetical protein
MSLPEHLKNLKPGTHCLFCKVHVQPKYSMKATRVEVCAKAEITGTPPVWVKRFTGMQRQMGPSPQQRQHNHNNHKADNNRHSNCSSGNNDNNNNRSNGNITTTIASATTTAATAT